MCSHFLALVAVACLGYMGYRSRGGARGDYGTKLCLSPMWESQDTYYYTWDPLFRTKSPLRSHFNKGTATWVRDIATCTISPLTSKAPPRVSPQAS